MARLRPGRDQGRDRGMPVLIQAGGRAGQFHKLIVWLEDTQIRALPEAQRTTLKAAPAPRAAVRFPRGEWGAARRCAQQWWPAFVEYCKGLGYKKPLPLPARARAQAGWPKGLPPSLPNVPQG